MTETKIIQGNQLQGQTEHQIVEHLNSLNEILKLLFEEMKLLEDEV